jgi:hypothetical protein
MFYPNYYTNVGSCASGAQTGGINSKKPGLQCHPLHRLPVWSYSLQSRMNVP